MDVDNSNEEQGMMVHIQRISYLNICMNPHTHDSCNSILVQKSIFVYQIFSTTSIQNKKVINLILSHI